MRSATVLLLAMVMVSCQSRPLSDVGMPLPTETEPALVRTPEPPSVGQGESVEALLTPQPTHLTPEATAIADVIVSSPMVVHTPTIAPARTAEPTTDVIHAGLEAEVWAAVTARWPASEWERAMRIAWCESRYQPWAAEPGGSHFGIYQVDPSLHGPVPSSIDGQAAQAYALWAQTGDWRHWSCQ